MERGYPEVLYETLKSRCSEPSLDALSLRSDVISSIKILSILRVIQKERWNKRKVTPIAVQTACSFRANKEQFETVFRGLT
jgi:hypothetical protein